MTIFGTRWGLVGVIEFLFFFNLTVLIAIGKLKKQGDIDSDILRMMMLMMTTTKETRGHRQ